MALMALVGFALLVDTCARMVDALAHRKMRLMARASKQRSAAEYRENIKKTRIV